MKAIIVPGVTDLNKGDQALVWESHRLIRDTKLYNEIFILESGDTENERKLLCSQTIDNGYSLIGNILKHPRRGKHKKNEHIKESFFEKIKQIKNAGLDFIFTSLLLQVCSNLRLVSIIYSSKVYETVLHFKSADTIFVKGGGFIHAYGESTASYVMWYLLFYVRLAKKLKKKVVFLPNSFGPFDGFTVKRQIINVLKDVDLIYAREQISSNSLGKLLKKEIPIELDLGFFLKNDKEQQAKEVLERYNIKASDKIVGLTIRPWRFPGKDYPEKLYENYINSMAYIAEHISAKGYKVVVCNQSLGPNSHEDDRNAIEYFFTKVSNEKIIWINENFNCFLLKAIYSQFYFFIGTRFHSIIFSITSLVPSIAIGYGGNKAQGIMRDFNLKENVIDIHNVNPDKLALMFDEAIDNYDAIKLSLFDSMALIEGSRNRMINEIISVCK